MQGAPLAGESESALLSVINLIMFGHIKATLMSHQSSLSVLPGSAFYNSLKSSLSDKATLMTPDPGKTF